MLTQGILKLIRDLKNGLPLPFYFKSSWVCLLVC